MLKEKEVPADFGARALEFERTVAAAVDKLFPGEKHAFITVIVNDEDDLHVIANMKPLTDVCGVLRDAVVATSVLPHAKYRKPVDPASQN